MSRPQILQQLAGLIVSVNRPHPTRVAIDGIDAAGKTTLADELVRPIEHLGRPVIRVSIDGFHRPRAERYRRGVDSAEGYYYDSFDYEALRTSLLLPLGPHGNRQYRRFAFDFRSDSPAFDSLHDAHPDAVLLFDGVFLLGPELNDQWDYRIFVEVDFQVAVERASLRDQELFGSPHAIRERYWKRYLPGQRIYLQTVRPRELADVIVENNDPENPKLFRREQIVILVKGLHDG